MTERLAIQTFFEQGEPLSDEIIGGFYSPEHDRDITVIPKVTLSDLDEHDFTPDDLVNQGIDVPDDEDDAFDFAVEQFRYSDAYYEWEGKLRPNGENYWLWHCEPQIGDQELADRIHEMGLNCCYVNGDHMGRTYQGFILTGGGMDLSDELAMAYISAGCVPPRELLSRAVASTRDDDWREAFLDAMARAASFMEGEVESYRETIERYRGAAPSLT